MKRCFASYSLLVVKNSLYTFLRLACNEQFPISKCNLFFALISLWVLKRCCQNKTYDRFCFTLLNKIHILLLLIMYWINYNEPSKIKYCFFNLNSTENMKEEYSHGKNASIYLICTNRQTHSHGRISFRWPSSSILNWPYL